MRPKSDLQELINSLSPTERAYYRKFARRHYRENSTFLKLFGEMEKRSGEEKYSESEIKTVFKDEKFVKQLPVVKIYLYNNILKSLNLYYIEDNIDLKLGQMINNAGILYRRELYDQCISMISKAKSLAEKFDKPVKLLEAIQIERLALRVNTPLNEVSNELMNNYNEEQEVLTRIKNISDYRKLYDMMVIHATAKGVTAGEGRQNTFEKLLANRMLKDYSNARYFQSKVIFLLMHCFINNLNGNKSRAYEYGMECLELFDEAQNNKLIAVYEYILILQELMQITYSFGKPDDSEIYFTRLQTEQDKLLVNSPGKVKNFLKVRTLMGRLNINSARGVYEKNLEVIRELVEVSGRNEDSSFRDEIIVTDFIASAVYFSLSMYNESVHHINRIFNSKAFELREDIQVSCRIINLILHYELGSMSSLEYYTRSTYRYLKKRKKLNRFEKLVFEFLKNAQRINDESELRTLFKETRFSLKRATNEEPGLLQVIDLDAWLESKLSKVPYLDIINKKNKKH